MITFASAYGSIQMSNPILGDADQFNLGTIYKITMSKNIHSTKQASVISTFLLTFDNVIQSDYEEFMDWFIGSRGQAITYTDYNGVAYTGIMKNAPIEVMVDGKRTCGSDVEKSTITVEFEAQR